MRRRRTRGREASTLQDGAREDGPGRFYRPSSMEMACVRAGLWRVEGVTVERVRRRLWQCQVPGEPGFSTLTAAVEWIYDQETDRIWNSEES